VQRVTRFVQYLPEFGWDPVVITRRMNKASAGNLELLNLLQQHTRIIRVGPFAFWRRLRARVAGSGHGPAVAAGAFPAFAAARSLNLRAMVRSAYRSLREFFVWPDAAIPWLPCAFFAALYQIATTKVDAVYTVSPPHSVHLVGAALRRLTGVRWISDYRDPWATDPDLILPTRLHGTAHRLAEGLCLRSADAVMATTNFHSNYIRSQMAADAAHRVHTVTNGYDAAEMTDLPEFKGTPFEIVYAGGFGYSRRATPLLSALQWLREREPEVFVGLSVRIIGTPNPLLTAEVQSFGLLEKVKFQTHMPHHQVLRELSQSAVLLLVVHSDEYVAQMCIPAKLFEYLATGRPILVISPPGSAAALVEESGAGAVLHPEDIEGIARAMVAFYRQYQRGELVRLDSPDMLRRFERRSLTESLSKLLERPGGSLKETSPAGANHRA
jgi:glycosyltransferase involved in cell wall biosynthesis